MFRALISCALLAALAIGPLLGQDPNAPPPQGESGGPDPDGQYEAGRAVARLSVAAGDVSVRRGDSGELVAAAVNAPLMADDHVLTSANSRAEIEFDSSNVVRIGPNSDVHLAALDIHSVQIQIAAGTVVFRTLRPGSVQVEVDTPSVAVRPLQPGGYRVTVREDGAAQMAISEITVRSGEAEIDSQRGSERLEAGQTMQARGPAADPEYQLVQGTPSDSFDRWNDERDRYFLASQTYERVNPAVAGGEDLDQNGRWVNDPQYGQVWQPTDVGPNWAPYQNGQWTWEDYYGWTWVSYDPWGWAPYHYGRWFWGAGGWAWWPGPVGPYPYWAPAYVGFFGYGPGVGFGVGFGFGGVGWVALAPYEVFHPWWGRGFYGGFGRGFYGGHTTVVNNINVYNSYRNARVTGGAIGMEAGVFGRGGRISALNRTQLASAGAVHGVLPVAPDRSSLRYSGRAVNGRYPQARSQTFAGRMQSTRVQRTSFEQQSRGMQQMSRGNFSRGSFNAGPRGFNGASTATHGWRSFGEPIHGTSSYGSAYTRSGASQFGRSYGSAERGYQGGAVRINPSIVEQRNAEQRNAEQRSYSSRPAPSYNSGGRGTASSARPSGGGGGGHAAGGGGGGHHR